MKKLIIEHLPYVELTSGNLKELLSLVENQETTDFEEAGEHASFSGEYGTYEYLIDEDLNVVLINATSY